MNTVGAPN